MRRNGHHSAIQTCARILRDKGGELGRICLDAFTVHWMVIGDTDEQDVASSSFRLGLNALTLVGISATSEINDTPLRKNEQENSFNSALTNAK